MTDTALRPAPKMGARTRRNTEAMLALCKARSFVVFDRESTHFQPPDHYGKIIELSAIKIVDGEFVEKFDALVNPEMKISSKISELTQITNDMVANAPTYHKVVSEFISFCEGSVIVAHNAMPDINYINFFSSKLGLPFNPEYIDTINLCKYIDQKNSVRSSEPLRYNLKEMAEKYGIENDNHHRAMNDTKATADLFLKLKEILKEDIERGHYKESKLNLDDVSSAVIGSVNYWEKDINGKLYKRIYVRLILNDKTNDIYYDFVNSCWGIKKTEFKMQDFKFMTDKLKQFMKLTDKDEVYDITTYKRG